MGRNDRVGAEDECQYCGKKGHVLAVLSGCSSGDGGKLGDNMLKDRSAHRMYAGANSLEAHHIIVSESMRGDNNPWAEYVHICGYSINHKNNGVFLTKRKDVACLLETPLHDGAHSEGETDTHLDYAALMKKKVSGIAKEIKAGDFCKDQVAVLIELDNLSRTTLEKINDFTYALTRNGKNYDSGMPGCGCGARKAHKIMGLEYSAEYVARVHLKATGALKDQLIESIKLSNEKRFKPKAYKPLQIGK